MCDASTVAAFSTGAQAVGVVASTSAAYTKSKADKAAYDYQAKIAENNAQADEWRAQDAIVRGQSAEAQQRLKTAMLAGTQRAGMAAGGLDLAEGSPLNILTDTAYQGELDANTIKDNASREAWGYRTQASNDRGNADLLRSRAAMENPGRAAATTFLTGAGSVASSWYGYQSKVNSSSGVSMPKFSYLK